MTKIQILIIALLLPVFGAGHVRAQEYDFSFDKRTELKEDTALSGRVYLRENIFVPKGITLTIKAGTVIKCANPGLCDDGTVNPSIIVEGSIIASGTKDDPIIFTAAEKNERNSFGEVYIQDSLDSKFEHCDFSFSNWGIHVHDSNVTVRNCSFKECFGGIRFKGDMLVIEGNEFMDNDTSLRFWQASPKISRNRFTNVGTAIFVREQSSGLIIEGNSFIDVKDYFIKLGELQKDDVTAIDCDFGTGTDTSGKIYDKSDDEYLGRVIINNSPEK